MLEAPRYDGSSVVQEEDERHIEVADAFERCALHALADFHGLHSASVDVSTGRSVRLRCSRARLSSTAACSPGDAAGTIVAEASDSTEGDADAMLQPAMQKSPFRKQPQHGKQQCPDGKAGESLGGAAADSSPAVNRIEKKEVDDRPAGEELGAPGERNSEVFEHSAGMQLPFTAVDIVAVLQEERQAQAVLGRHADCSLTVDSLIAHRQEHLPAEMCHNSNAAPS
jgi:hypothetical protein